MASSELGGFEVCVVEIRTRQISILQDGTGEGATSDLMVTSQGQAAVGDMVVVKGKMALDKDLGAGYKYDVIVEDAELKAE